MSRNIFIFYPLSEKETRNANKIRECLALQIGSKRLIYDLVTLEEGPVLIISKVPIFSTPKGRIWCARSLNECKSLIFDGLKINFKI